MVDSPRRLELASHIPEVHEALTGRFGGYGGDVEAIEQALGARVRVVLEHEVRPETLHHLSDLVRFVDDHLRDVAGIAFVVRGPLPEGAALLPWWRSAAASCRSREVGFVVEPPGALPEEPGEGLRQPPPSPQRFVEPEELAMYAVEAGVRSHEEATRAAVESLGGFARFVHPAKLGIPADVLAEIVAESPRDGERLARAHGAVPRVGLLAMPATGGTVPDERVVGAVAAACRALGTEPLVVESAETLEAAGSLDFHVVIAPLEAHPFSAGLAASLAALGTEDREAVLEAIGRAFGEHARGADSRPPADWLPGLISEVLAARGADPARAPLIDLWILDGGPLDFVATGTDPLGADRFALDTLSLTPSDAPWVSAALEAGHPHAERRSVRLRGVMPAERLAARLPGPQPGTEGPVILGLACTTLQNHAAALVAGGRVVAAVQEERLRRRKQTGWHPPGRPGVTVVSDGQLPLDGAWPRRSIDRVLERAGLQMSDVDVVAYNGVPNRFFPSYSLSDPARPPVTIVEGRSVYVPHHLSHAASAWRVSGLEDAFVFTVDGRGERDTAAFFEAEGGSLRRVVDVLVGEDSLIGGVYEYITTILGFGHYGQGSTMGLAAMGQPGIDLTRFLSVRSRDDHDIHDRGILEAFGHLLRDRDGPLLDSHLALAASVQHALEEAVIRFIDDGLGGRHAKHLCLAGGVALNCSMNQRLREHFGVEQIYVQPAAHDAGTALGAAVEAWWELTGEPLVEPLHHSYLGPEYSDAHLGATLERFALPFEAPEDLPEAVGELVASGRIVCWYQGGSEFGPRALGARSILADPRSREIKARLNVLKGRQWWRPFGPSILAGHEADFFEHPFHTPFMLFTLPVRPERQDDIPAVLHQDGTTRPQSVAEEVSPLYHRMISAFHSRTGIPMVVNTSFNTAHEPIVESPEDAIASFLALGADALALGPFLVHRSQIR